LKQSQKVIRKKHSNIEQKELQHAMTINELQQQPFVTNSIRTTIEEKTKITHFSHHHKLSKQRHFMISTNNRNHEKGAVKKFQRLSPLQKNLI